MPLPRYSTTLVEPAAAAADAAAAALLLPAAGPACCSLPLAAAAAAVVCRWRLQALEALNWHSTAAAEHVEGLQKTCAAAGAASGARPRAWQTAALPSGAAVQPDCLAASRSAARPRARSISGELALGLLRAGKVQSWREAGGMHTRVEKRSGLRRR